jgi:arylsulfatase A-like enzyme
LLEEFSQDEENPFFIRLDFDGPHPPLVVSEPYASMIDPADIAPLPNFVDPLINKPAIQHIKRKHWKTDQMTWADWQPLLAHYYGMVSLIDAQIGRVLDRLDELGLADDTLVLFTSDHGDTMGSHNTWNKDYTMYDEIYRIPFVARWPGKIEAGSRCDSYMHNSLDIAPTLLEAAGAQLPADIDGQTLLPLLKGQPQERLREAFAQFHGCHMGLYSMRMLQTDRFKYVFHVNDIDELYDHDHDPHELNNVANDPAYAEDIKVLRRQMVAWLARTKDHLYNEWIVYWLTDDMEVAAQSPGRMSTPMW